MDPACVYERTCTVNNLLWEDNGPAMNESLYDGWLRVTIDNENKACIWVSKMCFSVNMRPISYLKDCGCIWVSLYEAF